MNKKQYQALLVLLICYFTVFSTLVKYDTFDFLGWMMTMYLVGGYIRLYSYKLFDNKKCAVVCLVFSIILMLMNILVIDFVGIRIGFENYYYMLADSHKPLAFICSVSAFLFFKNLRIKPNKAINTIAASTFGVLLIHTNSDTMRKFLWEDLFHNAVFYNSPLLVFHAIGVTTVTYIICVIIDQLRIRFIEMPFLRNMDNFLRKIKPGRYEEKLSGK